MDTPDFDRLTRDLLRALRGERSQLAFSQLLGHRGNVSYRWEAGLRQPTAQALFTILDVLDIDVERALLALSPGALQQCRSVGGACDPAFPSALLRHLSAGRPATALAADVGRSGAAVRRVLRGESRPPLSTFLALLHASGAFLPGFLEAFVAPAALAGLGPGYRRSVAQREQYLRHPWTEAFLAVVETRDYRAQAAHSDAWIARTLGRPVEEIADIRRSLVSSGGLKWEDGRLRTQPHRMTSVNDPTLWAFLSDHWDGATRARPWGIRRSSWLVLSVTEEAAVETERILRRAWREIRPWWAQWKIRTGSWWSLNLSTLDGRALPELR